MFISYNWLRELTGTKLGPQEIRDRLTNVGLAVDAVETRTDDSVLDVEVPSNRGDCLSHVGIARELALIDKSKVQSPKSQAQMERRPTSPQSRFSIPIFAPAMPRGLFAASRSRRRQIGWLRSSKRLDSVQSITSPTSPTMCFTNWVSPCTRSISRSSYRIALSFVGRKKAKR